MARSNNSYIKKQKAEKRSKRKKEKLEIRIQKNKKPKVGNWENMIAYVDQFGNITTEPPAETEKKKENI
jgi:S-adenosylmethionine hydrolase